MRPPDSFIAQPIRSLQTMLRVLAENDDKYVAIIPDGIYGPETVRAVSTFQRQHGLPGLRIADIGCDTLLLREAQEAAEKLLEQDPELAAHPATAERVRELFTQSESSLN